MRADIKKWEKEEESATEHGQTTFCPLPQRIITDLVKRSRNACV